MVKEYHETDEVSRVVVRIQAGVLALVGALIGGIGLFVMTAWLLIKGGPQVGAHLQLLGHRRQRGLGCRYGLQLDRWHSAGVGR